MKWRSKPVAARCGLSSLYGWLDRRMFWFAFGSDHPMRFMR